MLLFDSSLALAFYLLWKLGLRAVVGTTADARGWGFETYFSALVHQIATTILALYLINMHLSDLSTWFSSTWSADMQLQRIDRFFCWMQAAEMATDIALHFRYPGFTRTCKPHPCILQSSQPALAQTAPPRADFTHHLFTFLGAVASIFVNIPVGGCICFGATMELGGLCINVVSLWPSLTGTHVPAILYTARVVLFVGSRVVGTVVVAWTTQLSIRTGAGVKYIPLLCCDMLS